MDSRYLQSFVYVVELGSIAEAARRLDLTPAAVAQRVKMLEAELGHGGHDGSRRADSGPGARRPP
jgi:DNA-binding transcriptional LysR family regulator